MACNTNPKLDAAQCHDERIHPVSTFVPIINAFSYNELKTMYFLLTTDLCNKESLSKYLKSVSEGEEYLRFQFSHHLHKKFSSVVMTELLGTMKKFRQMKELGVCKHMFKRQENMCNTIPEIQKFFFSLCEELDDDEVKYLRNLFFPDISRDMCGEELMCYLLLHDKISCTHFDEIKQALTVLPRHDLIREICFYELKVKGICVSDDFYAVRQPLYTKPCGLAILLNVKTYTETEDPNVKELKLEERKGSEADLSKLKDLWQKFGFKVEIPTDLTEDGLLKLLDWLNCEDISRDYDVLVVCIMSHGNEGCFYSSDSKQIKIEVFIEEVDKRCMKSKPKLFFIQACQGTQHNAGYSIDSKFHQTRRNLTTDSRPMTEIVPKSCDILKTVATINNHVSYRDEQQGSLFITSLVNIINEFGDKEHVVDIVQRVIKYVTDTNVLYEDEFFKQLPIFTSTLRKKLVLKHVQDV